MNAGAEQLIGSYFAAIRARDAGALGPLFRTDAVLVSAAGTENVLRYHPMPPGSAPPPAPAGFLSLNSPSMLQSWGRSSERQLESSNDGS